MRAEQGYYTRSRKPKFSSEAGYEVVDASEGIDARRAEHFISAIGEAVLFWDSGDTANEWMYAILPSRVNKALSVTRAMLTLDNSSPPRYCTFSHTYIYDAASAREIFVENMSQAIPVRVASFCNRFVGEQIGLTAQTPEIGDAYLPADTRLDDTGFDAQGLESLFNLIVALHENRRAVSNPLRYVFILYENESEAFKQQAFSLLSLLYAGLPYQIMSQLGVVVKAGKERWQSDFRSSSAYMVNQNDKKRFIPGGELYLVNSLQKNATDFPMNAVVVTVKESARAHFSISLNPKPAHHKFFGVIIRNIKNAFAEGESSLHEFYRFLHETMDDDLSFDNICNAYQLTEALIAPKTAIENGWKFISRILKMLAVSINNRFLDAQPHWKAKAEHLIALLLWATEKDEDITEENCFLLLQIGKKLTIDSFQNDYSEFLIKTGMFASANKRLLKVLDDNPEIIHYILSKDTQAKKYQSIRDDLLSTANLYEAEWALKYFDQYEDELTKEVENYIYALIQAVAKDDENRYPFEEMVFKAENLKKGPVWSKLHEFLSYKSYDLVEPQACFDFFSSMDINYVTLIENINNRKNAEPWTIKFLTYIALNKPIPDEITKMLLSLLPELFNTFYEDSDKQGMESIREYFQYEIKLLKQPEKFDIILRDSLLGTLRLLLVTHQKTNRMWDIGWDYIIKIKLKYFDEEYEFIKSFARLIKYAVIDTKKYDDIYTRYVNSVLERCNQHQYEVIIKMYQHYFSKMEYKIPSHSVSESSARLMALAAWGNILSKLVDSPITLSDPKNACSFPCKNCYNLLLVPKKDMQTERPKANCPLCNKSFSLKDETHKMWRMLIYSDFETLNFYLYKNGEKKEKNEQTLFKYEEKQNIAELTITGQSSEAAKFFSRDYAARRKRTCFIIKYSERDNIKWMADDLAVKSISHLFVREKDGETPLNKRLPRLTSYTANSMGANFSGEAYSFADLNYQGSRPDNIITDIASGLALYSLSCRLIT